MIGFHKILVYAYLPNSHNWNSLESFTININVKEKI